jgi:transcriptional regulator with XRE-family HTH domain
MGRDTVEGFAGRLRGLREAAGLTQAELSQRSGTHPTTVVKLEREERAPSLRLAAALAAALGVRVDDLIPGQPAPGPSRTRLLRAVESRG